jgi:menaquinone-dependent protoporphyrinogen oxidase
MSVKALVVYGSKYGSTAEIAEKIGHTLMESGMSVDVTSAKKAGSPESYDVIVIGSALYIGQWRKEVIKYIKKNQDTLKTKKVWVFSSGPTGKEDPVKGVQGRLYPEKLQAAFSAIKPADITVFHGNLCEEKISGFEKFVINKVNAPLGDFRDWKSIESWAKRITKQAK